MRVLVSDEQLVQKVVLDKKDERILQLLCYNIRLPLQKISSEVGLSRQSVDYRIKQMEKSELITGSRTVINIGRFGYYKYHYFVSIISEEHRRTLIDRCKKHPNVNTVISYSGKWNMEISITARDPRNCQEVFKNLMEELDSVNYSVCIILSTLKASVLPQYKLDELPVYKNIRNDPSFHKQFLLPKIEHDIDEKDISILRNLADNARATLTAVSKNIGLTRDAVSYRIKNLIRGGYITEFRPVINYAALSLTVETILIKVARRTPGDDEKFRSFLETDDSILWGAETMGGWDYLVYVITSAPDKIHDFVNMMKTRFDSYITSYEILFVYHEYKYSFMAESVTVSNNIS